MERLRIALGWEVTPVLTGFGADDGTKEYWFEKPFNFLKQLQ